MKKVICLVLVLAAKFAFAETQGWIEKVKQFNLSFDARNIVQVNVTNQFGNVKVVHWEKKSIRAEVTVRANAVNNTLIDRYLDNIDIKNNVKNGVVVLQTWMGNSALIQARDRKTSYCTVDYIIYMPDNINLQVNNSFGDVELPDFYAPLQVSVQHGNLKAPVINNTNSQITMRFSTAQIRELVGATLNSVNSTVRISTAKNVDLNCEKGVLVADNLENIKGFLKYSKSFLNNLGEEIELNISFTNDLKLGNLNQDLKKLLIQTNYSDIQLPSFSGFLDVQTTNGQFFVGQGVDARVKKDKSSDNTRYFNAVIGEDDTPKKVVIIKANNGDVKIR
ncbi:hypothetical protein [Leadbetterella sp. DM7]|uniref:hypothetical protein n=1 Tax=Leadbetterella sp. DM7 TaxID=3235085 RepID=UPI00349E7C19